MKTDLTLVNTRALISTLTLIGGEELVGIAAKLYSVIDQSQVAGYNAGHLDGYQQGHEQGYMQAQADGLVSEMDAVAQAEDEGYVAGVHDARVNPAVADLVVEEITREQNDEFAGDFYEGDSGDETDFVCDALKPCACMAPEDCDPLHCPFVIPSK
jgi:hypothetical protein